MSQPLTCFTEALVREIAATCNTPTGDAVLDRFFETYNTGSPRRDEPVYYRFLYRLAERLAAEKLCMMEVGFKEGGASLHFLKGGGRCSVGIDCGPPPAREPFEGFDFRTVTCRSTSPEALAAVNLLPRDDKRPDIVFIDTDHSYSTTIEEYRLWRRRLRPGGMMLFDDICAPEFGCTRFWEELEPPARAIKLTLPGLHPLGWGFGILIMPYVPWASRPLS